VPQNAKRVLDVGCSVGTLGEAIAKRNQAEVVGIELDSEMAKLAQVKLDRVIVGNVENLNLDSFLTPYYFDCIIFGDILEHLIDPWSTLAEFINYLQNDGVIIISIPNIKHISTIINLFRGYWPYRERGIHDKTHLRFFTYRNIMELVEQAGLSVTKIERKYRIIEHPHRLNKLANLLALPIIKDFFTFQYLIATIRKQ